MNINVKNFIETNYQLLETDPFEFFHAAYNGLSIPQQTQLVEALDEAEIETLEARESVIRYIITMNFDVIERPVALRVIVARMFRNVLGFDSEWLFNYILDNQNEWDNKIIKTNGTYYVYPVV